MSGAGAPATVEDFAGVCAHKRWPVHMPKAGQRMCRLASAMDVQVWASGRACLRVEAPVNSAGGPAGACVQRHTADRAAQHDRATQLTEQHSMPLQHATQLTAPHSMPLQRAAGSSHRPLTHSAIIGRPPSQTRHCVYLSFITAAPVVSLHAYNRRSRDCGQPLTQGCACVRASRAHTASLHLQDDPCTQAQHRRQQSRVRAAGEVNHCGANRGHEACVRTTCVLARVRTTMLSTRIACP